MPLTVSDGLRSGECDAQPSVPDSRCRRAVGAAAVTKGAAEVPHVVSGLHTVPGPAESKRGGTTRTTTSQQTKSYETKR